MISDTCFLHLSRLVIVKKVKDISTSNILQNLALSVGFILRVEERNIIFKGNSFSIEVYYWCWKGNLKLLSF